jgi:hypothetical protein
MAASVEGKLTEGYLAPNTFIHKRDIRKKIFPRYRESNLFDALMFTQRTLETDNTRFNHFEDDYLYSSVQVASATGGNAAGAPVTVTITAASHQETGKLSPGKKWDEVLLNGIRGWVASVDKTTAGAHTYTIKPIRSTDNFGAPAGLANLYIALFSTAKSDGSGQATSMVRKPLQFYNHCQIFSTQFLTYGSESANKVEFEIGGKPYYYLKGMEDGATKHNLDISFAFMFGEETDLTTPLVDADNANEPVYTTRGMEAYVRDFGNNKTYTSVDFAVLQDLEKTLSLERGPNNYWMLNGINFQVALMGVVKDEMENSGIDYSVFGAGNAKQNAIDFGFNSFRFSKRTFHALEFDPMHYRPVSALANYPYPDMSFAVPMDKVANPRPTNANDEYYDTIAVRYKKNDRENRFVKHWTRDVTITNMDQLEGNWLSECGLQLACLNQFVKLAK